MRGLLSSNIGWGKLKILLRFTMYGKIFEQIYESSVCEDWKALVVFQQLIVLSDSDGTIDMTHESISRRTNIPIDIIRHGIDVLEKPDAKSRTKDFDGRRIIRLDEHRDWGWFVVNKGLYCKKTDREKYKEQNRLRQKRHREKSNVSNVTVTQNNAIEDTDVDTDVDTDNKTTLSGKPDQTQLIKNKEFLETAKEVVLFLNEKTGRNYEPKGVNLDMIVARLKEGATLKNCRQIIAKKSREWSIDEKMSMYLRPKTLFNKTNFAQYKGELLNLNEVSNA